MHFYDEPKLVGFKSIMAFSVRLMYSAFAPNSKSTVRPYTCCPILNFVTAEPVVSIYPAHHNPWIG